MKNLEVKKVIITGASRGLGKVLALEFAKGGHEMILLARNEQNLAEVCSLVVNLGGKANYVISDVTNANAHKNDMLKAEFKALVDKGVSNIYYIDNQGAYGPDNEGTVDGVHFTDLGFLRYAEFLISKFEQLNLPTH